MRDRGSYANPVINRDPVAGEDGGIIGVRDLERRG
jgi:hypothetical protein